MAAQLKNLMQGLYYPAVTGTGLVIVLCRLTMHDSPWAALTDYAVGYGLLFVLFFSGSFVAISMVPGKTYSAYEFVLDIAEVVLAFGAFYFLGLFDANKIQTPNLRGVYGSITALAVVQTFWRLFLLDDHEWALWRLRMVALAVASGGFVYLHLFDWFNTLALGAMLLLVMKYIVVLSARAKNQA